jgi:hypothetical protein
VPSRPDDQDAEACESGSVSGAGSVFFLSFPEPVFDVLPVAQPELEPCVGAVSGNAGNGFVRMMLSRELQDHFMILYICYLIILMRNANNN